jgi:hypothetical protein
MTKMILCAARLEKGGTEECGEDQRRHGAITNNFSTWRNNKSWAEKIRGM